MASIFGKTKTAGQPFRVHSLEDASTEYADLKKRRQAFIDQKSQLERDRDAHALTDFQVFHAAQRMDRAGALVTGDVVLSDMPVSPESAWRAKFAEIDRQIADAKSAIELLDQKIAVARRKATTVIVDEVRDEYQARVLHLCQALIAAHGASKNLEDLKAQFNDRDLAWSGPLQPIGAAALHDGYSTFLQTAVRDGFITAGDVPGVLLK